MHPASPGRGAILKRAISLVFVFLLLAVLLFHFAYVPWQRTWGASAAEVSRTMPGDEVVALPNFDTTRAITRATPDQIWPWLVQMGYRRAGFYSWDRLDNDGIPSARHILPQFQDLAIGDFVPLSENGRARVIVLEASRFLVLEFESSEPVAWAWGLYPQDDGTTRLVSRLRVATEYARTLFVLNAFEIIMMRKCLHGIRDRAEAGES